MQKVSCTLCGSDEFRRLYVVKKKVPIVRCVSCGLVFVHPRPASDAIADLYQTQDYFKNKNILLYGYDDYMNEEGLYRVLFKRRLDRLEKITQGRRGKLLDIGCAVGYFLDIARSRGWETKGVELSAFASRYARERFGLDVFTGSLFDAGFGDGQFDVVVMDDVVEHVLDPLAELKEIHRILRPGGVLTLNTPNVGGILKKVMRRRWFHFKEDHLYFFSPETISRALKEAGFDVLSIHASGKIVTFKYLIGRLNHYSRTLAWMLDWLVGSWGIVHQPFYLFIGEMVATAKRIE